ncbi:MAG: hypothetical protein H7196_02205 [candidate division SR1 bacterium]|nr:hypothetical protein [candidate division SR1 bacterium]
MYLNKKLQFKKIIAISISIVIVTLAIVAFVVLNKKKKTDQTNNTSYETKDILDKLGKSIDKINLDDVLYDTISFKELPVYPKAWVEKYFSFSEQANQLISGPNADADGDGLTNKEEYFYASSPVNKDTLCNGSKEEKGCNGNNDKQNVDAGISPLTGLTLDSYDKVKIKKQDYAILNRIQDSFENAAKEGVDFPTLYQLSKTIDLNDEYKKISALTQSNDRVNIVNYISFRAKLLQNIIDESEVGLFSELYQSTKIDEIKNVKKKYLDKNEELKNTYVPERFVELHRAYIFFFDKIIQLLDLRIEGISEKKTESKDFRNRSKKMGVEIMWSYRKLSDISSDLKIDLNSQ